MSEEERFSTIPKDISIKILNKMTIATFGLADLMAKGMVEVAIIGFYSLFWERRVFLCD
jgi:hypothetical protein